MNNTALSIKYLINLFDDTSNQQINSNNNLIIENKLLVDSYQSIMIDDIITFDHLIKMIVIAYSNQLSVTDDKIKQIKKNIRNKIMKTEIDIGKKKKYITSLDTSTDVTNELILLLSYYFDINIILYNPFTKLSKCFYFDNFMDKDLPFIIIKEMKNLISTKNHYELIKNQHEFIFSYNDLLIQELIKGIFIIGIEPGKKLEYLNSNIHFTEFKNINPIIKLQLLPLKYTNTFVI